MKIVEVKDVQEIEGDIFATAVIENRSFWLGKKTVTEAKIFKEEYALFWAFVDTGKFTPNTQVESLFKSIKAKKKLATKEN